MGCFGARYVGNFCNSHSQMAFTGL
uniref:Uncharacterized protein n=1 Tax=Rhizophora mucronata TaxID=61149 RepID=A0A2P2NAR9_RHIMU